MDVIVAEDVVPSVAVFCVVYDARRLHDAREEVVSCEVRERLHFFIAQFKPHLCLPLHAGRPGLAIRRERGAGVIADLLELAIAPNQHAGVGVERFFNHALANRFRNLAALVEKCCDLRTHRLLVISGRIEKGRQLRFTFAIGLEPQRPGGRIREGSCVITAIPTNQHVEVGVIGDSQFQSCRLFGAIDLEMIRAELVPCQ